MIRSKLAAIVCGLSAAAPVVAQDLCGPLTARPSFTDTTVVLRQPRFPPPTASRRSARCRRRSRRSPGSHDRRGLSPARQLERQGARHRRRRLRRQRRARGAQPTGLARGYAVIQNDLGHPSDERARSVRSRSKAPGQPQRRRRSSTSATARHTWRRSSARTSSRSFYGRAPQRRVLAGLLDRRPPGARRSPALSRRLRRRDRRRTRLHAARLLERDPARAGVSRANRRATCCPRTCR